MKVTERVYLVGSGAIGLSNAGDCHVYLLDGGSALALVDAGCGEGWAQIVANVEDLGFDPGDVGTILLTHAHRDHANGAPALRRALQERRPGAGQIAASAAEARLLAAGSIAELGLDLLGMGDRPRAETFPPFAVDRVVADGETLHVGDLALTAIEVPGHNPGCLCYAVQIGEAQALFTGDVIYPGGVISLGNWPGSELAPYREGLRKLAGLGVDALLPGHLLWTVRGGQAHIDAALAAFCGLWPPPNIHTRM